MSWRLIKENLVSRQIELGKNSAFTHYEYLEPGSKTMDSVVNLSLPNLFIPALQKTFMRDDFNIPYRISGESRGEITKIFTLAEKFSIYDQWRIAKVSSLGIMFPDRMGWLFEQDFWIELEKNVDSIPRFRTGLKTTDLDYVDLELSEAEKDKFYELTKELPDLYLDIDNFLNIYDKKP